MEVISQEQDLVDIDRNETLTGPKVRLFCLVLFFVAVACTYLQWYPHDYRSFKVEDSGLFLHIGQRLTHGDVLYRDIADNKPPLIYWLNEFGLLLGHGSPGGVFLLCLAAGIFTFAVVYWGLRHYVGWPLFIIAGCWSQLAFLTCAFHPNYTESFSTASRASGRAIRPRTAEWREDHILCARTGCPGSAAVLLACE
ncbi:MAG: hypothetical protein JO217_04590 [Acidobacteriaceae bacterium]|nr:hypothetical protein [Acidobacteriaceae bacterium]